MSTEYTTLQCRLMSTEYTTLQCRLMSKEYIFFSSSSQPFCCEQQVYSSHEKDIATVKLFKVYPYSHSHQFQLFHDSSRQQYGYVHHYSIELIAFSAEYTLFNNCNFNLVYRYSLSVKFNSVYYSELVTRQRSYSCFVVLKMGYSETRNMQSSSQTEIKSVTCAFCWDLYTRM